MKLRTFMFGGALALAVLSGLAFIQAHRSSVTPVKAPT